MRLALVCEYDPTDINSFSGTPYHFFQTFQSLCERLELVRIPNHEASELPTMKMLKHFGRAASASLAELDVDAVLCQGNSPIPFIETDLPVAYWHDSTWSSLFRGHLSEVLDFATFSKRYPDLKLWDEMALRRADCVIFAADWLVDVAMSDYGVNREKLAVVPFGTHHPACSEEAVLEWIARRSQEPCRLLFLGKDWRRKGLSSAMQLAEELNRRGVATALTTIGFDPTEVAKHPSSLVRHLGFLDKREPAQSSRITDALSNSHFLVHPASFEAFGYALVEASAHGLPILGTRTTGLLTIVRDGHNGFLFDEQSFVEDAATRVATLFSSYEDSYVAVAKRSYAEFTRRFSWKDNASQVLKILRAACRSRSRRRPGR
jgi:glycosyltransferase involved in cell wall biosynthesis